MCEFLCAIVVTQPIYKVGSDNAFKILNGRYVNIKAVIISKSRVKNKSTLLFLFVSIKYLKIEERSKYRENSNSIKIYNFGDLKYCSFKSSSFY